MSNGMEGKKMHPDLAKIMDKVKAEHPSVPADDSTEKKLEKIFGGKAGLRSARCEAEINALQDGDLDK